MKLAGILLALLLVLVPVALAQAENTDLGEAKIMISQDGLEGSAVTQERAQAEGFWNVDPVIASLDWIFAIVGALISTVEAFCAWLWSICPSAVCVTIWDLIWEFVDTVCASIQDLLVGLYATFCASLCGFIFGICGSFVGVCVSLCGTFWTELADLIAGGIEALLSTIGICCVWLTGIDFINYCYQAILICICEVIPFMSWIQTAYLCCAGFCYLIPCGGQQIVGAIPAYITLCRSWVLQNCQNVIPIV